MISKLSTHKENKVNILLSISLACFVSTSLHLYKELHISFTIFILIGSFFIGMIIPTQFKTAYNYILNKCVIKNKIITIISILSAIGICQFHILREISYADKIFLIICTIIATPIIFMINIFVLNFIYDETKNIIQNISTKEFIVYVILFLIMSIYIIYSFDCSTVFYGNNLAEKPYDYVYSSDSVSIINDNAYMLLWHKQNDLRQPLFSIFSMALIGPIYLVSYPFSKLYSPAIPIATTIIQYPILLFTLIIIADMMKLNAKNRLLFIIFANCSFCTLLNIIMIEQYVISVFWTIFALHLCLKKSKNKDAGIIIASTTLITNSILFLIFYEDWKNFKISKCIKTISIKIYHTVVLTVIFKVILLLQIGYSFEQYEPFLGKISITQRLMEYTVFVKNIFLYQKSIVKENPYGYMSYQLPTPDSLNIIGIIILLLCGISIYINKDKVITKISAIWILLSILILVIFGWGASENAQILYSLYFGWPFIILIFQLIEKITEKLHSVIILLLSIPILYFNISGIKNLLEFAITYYPR